MKLTNNFLLLPRESLDVSQLLVDSGRSHNDASKTVSTTGISSISYAFPKLLTEFIFEGLIEIQKTSSDILSDIDAVIVVSQSYDQRIPTISARIQKKLNLSADTFCIDVMDGCSGYIKALRITSMLASKGHKKVLIVAGDLHSIMTLEADIGTKILFGDGVSVTILEADDSALDTRIFNDGDNNNVISCSIQNSLNMNGFEVFRFTKNTVPQLISSYLEETGKSLHAYDMLALHQASKLIVSAICNTLKYKNTLGEDFSCGDFGNIGSGSIGAWLSNISQLEKKGKLNMLAVGFGSGLSWGLASVVVDIQKNKVIYV
ncbi:MAG: hypothetical protein HOG49_28995 [Candidatus Scalindua sp.]|jgi:3-oxoacyl-[acyl-carrier-protein] synthase III|nr:hypothetical protein [Candidatus Scalindua sp.]